MQIGPIGNNYISYNPYKPKPIQKADEGENQNSASSVNQPQTAETLPEPEATTFKASILCEVSLTTIITEIKSGNFSILSRYGIPYSVINIKPGHKQVTFYYKGVRYTVNIIDHSREGENNVVGDSPNTKKLTDDDKDDTKINNTYNITENANTKNDENAKALNIAKDHINQALAGIMYYGKLSMLDIETKRHKNLKNVRII